jgi:hypothetical protein
MFSYVEMPLNENGDGPASEEETVAISYQVWDSNYLTVATCSCAYYAKAITNLLNRAYVAGEIDEQS